MQANVTDVLELQLRAVEGTLRDKANGEAVAEYSNQELADALTQTEAAIEKYQKELDELAGGRGDASKQLIASKTERMENLKTQYKRLSEEASQRRST